MARGWTWIDDETERTDEDGDRLTPVLDRLAAEWSHLHDTEERRGFERMARFEDGDYGPDYDTQEEADQAEFEQREREQLRAARHDAEVQVIESALARHGARMMRAYEHWNEDERYMQHMESDRFGDSC